MYEKYLLEACGFSDRSGDVIRVLFIIDDVAVKNALDTDSIAVDLANGWNNMIRKMFHNTVSMNSSVFITF